MQAVLAQSGPPAAVTAFEPSQGATGVLLATPLSWVAAPGATSYDVYFGTTTMPPFVGNTTQTTYSPVLSPNTIYYWYLVSRNAEGSATSFLWYFTTGTPSGSTPSAVTVFSPTQGSTGISLSPTLTWSAATGAASYDVYFGSSNPPPFVANTTLTSYMLEGLNPDTTYYWLLVSRNTSGTAASVTWSFTTAASPSHPPFFAGEISEGNGVYYLQFPNKNIFGFYNYQYFPILYHYDLGFEYFVDANDGQGGAYFYDYNSGHWFYTSPAFSFPYLYDFTLKAILYYFPNPQSPGHYSTNPRYFYNFATGMTIAM